MPTIVVDAQGKITPDKVNGTCREAVCRADLTVTLFIAEEGGDVLARVDDDHFPDQDSFTIREVNEHVEFSDGELGVRWEFYMED